MRGLHELSATLGICSSMFDVGLDCLDFSADRLANRRADTFADCWQAPAGIV